MSINFVVSIDNISERQLDFIKKVLEKRGYNNIKATIDPVGAAGDNYIANVKRITMSDDNGVFKMIAKLAPQNEILRATTNTLMLFKNEHLMYTEILPKFREMEVIADIPDEDRLRFAACYGSFLEAPNEVILLEDLQASNFIMLDRFKSLSDECVKSILKSFANLHSLSFVLKNIEPDTFKVMKNDLFDNWATLATIPQTKTYFGQMEKDLELLLEGDERKRLIKGAISEAFVQAIKLSKSEVDSKHSVIQQGDSWTNNVMFKFDGDQLQQSVMIDYQLSKESNPTRDIQYLIFNCTDHKTRLEYFHDWMDYYHSELEKRLSNYGLKPKYVYPRDQLDADMKRYARLMFGLSAILAVVITMKSDDADKMKKAMESVDLNEKPELLATSNVDSSNALLLKTKVEDLIDSYVYFGLLQ